jgi:hypothetical protein
MEKKLIPGTCLKLSQRHGSTVSRRSDAWLCAADPRPKSVLSACSPSKANAYQPQHHAGTVHDIQPDQMACRRLRILQTTR